MFYKNVLYASCIKYGISIQKKCLVAFTPNSFYCVFTSKTRVYNDFTNNLNGAESYTTPRWSGLGLAPFEMKARRKIKCRQLLEVKTIIKE